MDIVSVGAVILFFGAQPQLVQPSEAGVQIASVQLCSEAVVSAGWENTKRPILTLQLSKTAADAIQRRTHALVGKSLRVTLNGQLMHEIYVIEPLISSSVRLPSTMNEAAGILSAVSKTPCP